MVQLSSWLTLFDAPRTLISFCINMSKEHVGGVACHCIVCTFFCVSSFLSQVVIRCGLVTAFRLGLGLGLPGDDEASLLRSGEEHLRHAPQWCTVCGRVRRWHTCCADTWCQAWGASMLCATNRTPSHEGAKTGWPVPRPANAFLF
jgi:hypothetical protein